MLVQLGGQPGQGRDRLQPAQVAVQVVVADRDVGEAVALRGLDLTEQRSRWSRGGTDARTSPRMTPISTLTPSSSSGSLTIQ